MTDLTMSQFASKDDLLAAQAARIAELESQLEAIGAGGVEPLRKQAAQAAHQIAEPAAPVGKPIEDAIDALVWAAFTEGGCSEHRMSEARIQTELRKKELRTLIAATQPAAQGLDEERLRNLLCKMVDQLERRWKHRDGNAPGHGHSIPGVWDSDNGELAGKKCAWCEVWQEALEVHAAAQAKQGGASNG